MLSVSATQHLNTKMQTIRYSANTRNWPNIGSMLVQRLRRWPNIEPILGEFRVFAGYRVADLHVF